MAEHETYRATNAFETTNWIISKILFTSLLISQYTAVAAFNRSGLSFRPRAAFANYWTSEKGFAPSLQFSEMPISIGIQNKDVNDYFSKVPAFMHGLTNTQQNKAVLTSKATRQLTNRNNALHASALSKGLQFSSIINWCLVKSPIEFRFIYQPFLIMFYWPFYAVRNLIVSAQFPSVSLKKTLLSTLTVGRHFLTIVNWCLASSPIELRFLYQPILIMFYWPFYAFRSLIVTLM